MTVEALQGWEDERAPSEADRGVVKCRGAQAQPVLGDCGCRRMGQDYLIDIEEGEGTLIGIA